MSIEWSEEEVRNALRAGGGDDKYSAGQVTIVGGSDLFHGSPILALKAASRIVSMVYMVTPFADKDVLNEIKMKAGLSSFIWVPREEVDAYIQKSDAVLIGPGMKRNHKEEEGMVCDNAGRETKIISERLLTKFAEKKWVIDGGSLQVVDSECLPKGAVITANKKEWQMLFGEDDSREGKENIAKEKGLVIVHKADVSWVTDGERTALISGGSEGLVKGGVGDVVAGVTVGLLAKNRPFEAAAGAIWLVKKAARELEGDRGVMFNADDLADKVAEISSRMR